LENCPLNPPILGDFELRKVVNSPQSWGAGGAKNLSVQTSRGLIAMIYWLKMLKSNNRS
jgi:hypothetical protein